MDETDQETTASISSSAVKFHDVMSSRFAQLIKLFVTTSIIVPAASGGLPQT
jgi:hypothetical protein